MITVYGLFIDGRCVYVGRTSNLEQRNIANSRRVLRAYGQRPVVKSLKLVQPREAGRAEWEAIRSFKAIGQATLNKLSAAKFTGFQPESKLRNLAVYKDDYDFFAEVADQNDRSRARMFRYAMAQIRSGLPVPFTADNGRDNGK